MGPVPLRQYPFVLGSFLKDPLGSVRRPFDFSWPLIIALLASCALVSGGISGAISGQRLDFIVGLFVFPITSVVSSIVFGFFIYYFFSLYRSTFLDFRRLMSLVSVAVVPYFLFHSVAGYLMPIDLLGFAFTCVLMIVGLVEQFGLERKLCSKLMFSVAVLFCIAWTAAAIRGA